MKKWQKISGFLLAGCLVLGMTACGGEGKESEESEDSLFGGVSIFTRKEGDSDGSPSSSAGKNLMELCDTWENAMGGSGPVEYEYIEIDLPQDMEDVDLTRSTYTDASEAASGRIRKVSKMTLKNELGYVWRMFEFEYHYDSPIDLYDEVRTYNGNGELLYTTTTYYTCTNTQGEYTGRIIKNFAQSFDAKREKIAQVEHTGGDWLQFESAQWDGIYDSSHKFCVFAYDDQGRKIGAREYKMDGMIVGHWEYVWEDGKLTEVNRRNEYDGWSKYTSPEFDSQGRLTALYDRVSGDSDPLFTFVYDEQGRLIERTGYNAGNGEPYHQSFHYREDGTLESCRYLESVEDLNRIQEGNLLYIPSFLYDEKGRLTVEDHGYLISGSRTSCWTYEYYDNGIISVRKEYRMGDYEAGEEPERETHYEESGNPVTG